MLEARFLLWAVTIASVLSVPFEIMAGIRPVDAFIGAFRWLSLLIVVVLIRRRLAARKGTIPLYRISNAALLWCLLFLVLSLGLYYWQNPVDPAAGILGVVKPVSGK